MNEELLSIQDILKTVRKHLLLIVLTVVACEGAAVLAVKFLPRKFKSSALLNIQATYFEVPLLGDSIIGSRDPVEMMAQKRALMRLALSDVFLDKEGEKYHLFKTAANSTKRSGEREKFRKLIECLSTTTTTFQVSAISVSPEIAYGLASDALDQIVDVVVAARQKSIMTYRESLHKQLDSLGVATSATDQGDSGALPQVMKEELLKLESKLTTLRSQYNSNHPKIVGVQGKIQTLKQQLEQAEAKVESRGTTKENLIIDPNVKGRRAVFGEQLLTKINYIDIAMELESNKKELPYLEILERPTVPSTYFFPNVPAFGIGGILIGFLIAGLAVAVKELKRMTAITPAAAARQFGVPLLGLLPVMVQTAPTASASPPPPPRRPGTPPEGPPGSARG